MLKKHWRNCYSDGNVLRIGSDPEKGKPLGVWRDGDGIGWRHLGDQKYERVD